MRLRSAAALPAVLFAMALTSALVVGGVYAARTMASRAWLTKSAAELPASTERVLVDVVADWDTAGLAAMPIGAVVVESPVAVDGVLVSVRVTRLNQYTYWMVAEAAGPISRRIESRLGLLARSAEGRIRPVDGPAWTRLP